MAIDLPVSTIKIIKVYVPTRKKSNVFPASYTPSLNAVIAVDFNGHHTMWYGHKAPNWPELIANGRTKREKLVQFIQGLRLMLQSISVTLTDFP